jgi:hypothetical protein
MTAATIEERKAADEAQYEVERAATTPEGPTPQELAELCDIHAEKMWGEGWYTTARALYLAAEKLNELTNERN